jgi:hypothetical protein
MEIWGLVGSLAGVVLGWGLTQASGWLGARQADRRTLKEALYFLLELRGLLRKLYRWNQLIPQHIVKFRRHLPPPSASEETGLDELLGSWLRAMQLPLIGPQLVTLKAGYEAGLLKLATLDPVNAYRLRGIDELLQQLPQVVGAVETASIAQLNMKLPMPPEMTDFIRQYLEPERIQQALELVHSVIEELALQLDRSTRDSLKAEWGREQEQDKKGLDEFDEYMEKMRTVFPTAWAP